jgi:hypothetical protein
MVAGDRALGKWHRTARARCGASEELSSKDGRPVSETKSVMGIENFVRVCATDVGADMSVLENITKSMKLRSYLCWQRVL